MIHITRTLELPHCGTMDLDLMNTANQDLTSPANGRGRQRSHSYYSAEDAKKYGLHEETEKIVVRPRSRYSHSSKAIGYIVCFPPLQGNIMLCVIHVLMFMII